MSYLTLVLKVLLEYLQWFQKHQEELFAVFQSSILAFRLMKLKKVFISSILLLVFYCTDDWIKTFEWQNFWVYHRECFYQDPLFVLV